MHLELLILWEIADKSGGYHRHKIVGGFTKYENLGVRSTCKKIRVDRVLTKNRRHSSPVLFLVNILQSLAFYNQKLLNILLSFSM